MRAEKDIRGAYNETQSEEKNTKIAITKVGKRAKESKREEIARR